MLEHRVECRQQFPHIGDENHLLGFSQSKEREMGSWLDLHLDWFVCCFTSEGAEKVSAFLLM